VRTPSKAAALEALESMDDFARMDVGVDPVGPYKVLKDFIEEDTYSASNYNQLCQDFDRLNEKYLTLTRQK
jgi:hypothetical protein